MAVTAIVGAQWGDEGKGKITDLLAQDADLVIRFGGGGNAGHTVVNRFGEFKLHHIPSGIFNDRALSLIGTGAVVDFDFLADEEQQLIDAGLSTDGLRVSSRAHVVMPYHLALDRLGDEARGSGAIGTTRRGVGPTYVDKADRIGIQVCDVLDPRVLRHKLDAVLPPKNRLLTELFGSQPYSLDDLMARAEVWRERFGPRVVDQVPLLATALAQDQAVLLEGQLGAMRDLDWGTYPYVTSSTTVAGGGAVGGGIPPTRIENVVGIVKAYTTAVGAGPLPTELHDETGEILRTRGAEFGATTGRPRRVGWFDAVAARYSCLLNRFTGIAVTKLDVLDGLDTVRICTSYRRGADRFSTVPPTAILEQVEPVYEEIPGWNEPTGHVKAWHDLPPAARAYLERIEELTGAPISIVSVGRDREETIIRSQAVSLR